MHADPARHARRRRAAVQVCCAVDHTDAVHVAALHEGGGHGTYARSLRCVPRGEVEIVGCGMLGCFYFWEGFTAGMGMGRAVVGEGVVRGMVGGVYLD